MDSRLSASAQLRADVEAATLEALQSNVPRYAKCPELHELLVDAVMKPAIAYTLERQNGVVARAARDVGISRKTFHILMRKYGIGRPTEF